MKFILLLALLGLIVSPALSIPSALTTKVFSAVGDENEPATATVSVDAGYKLVGGGFSGTGFYVRSSYPLNATTWFVETSPVVGDESPNTVTAYAVGLYDPDNNFETEIFTASGTSATVATASVTPPSPYVLTGGGGSTDEFLTASFPNPGPYLTATNIWTANATFYPDFEPTTISVTVYAIGIAPTGTGYFAQNFINSVGTADPATGGNEDTVTATAPPQESAAVTSGGGFSGPNTFFFSSYPSGSDWTSTGQNSPSSTGNAGVDSWDVSLALGVSDDSDTATASATTASSTTASATTASSATAAATTGSSGTGSSTSSTSQCSSVTITQTLVDSWDGGSEWSATIANTGSELISAIEILAAESEAITDLWSMTADGDGSYSLPSWISSIAISGSITFGYTASQATQISFSLTAVECPSSSASGTTATGTTTGSASSGSCSGVTVTQKLRTTWLSGTQMYYLYDITVTASSTTTISSTATPDLGFDISSQDGSVLGVSQTWNLVTDASTVPSSFFVALEPSTVIAPGQSYTSAGYVADTQTNIVADC